MTTGKRLLSKIKPSVNVITGISHPYRLAMVYLVAQKPMSERDFVRRLQITQTLASHHIRLLRKAGWLKKKRVGKLLTYTIKADTYKQFIHILDDTPFGRTMKKLV